MQWAEVLSADAFSAFEDAGLNNDKVFDVLRSSVFVQGFILLNYTSHSHIFPLTDGLQQAVKETGHRFRETVLALGGGKAPLEVRSYKAMPISL